MKYCGVATSFRGIRVKTRSAIGMPGSETACGRVLSHFIQEGFVAKLPPWVHAPINLIMLLWKPMVFTVCQFMLWSKITEAMGMAFTKKMGIPGSETALEELMCRLLGDLVQEGFVAELAHPRTAPRELVPHTGSPRPLQPPTVTNQGNHMSQDHHNPGLGLVPGPTLRKFPPDRYLIRLLSARGWQRLAFGIGAYKALSRAFCHIAPRSSSRCETTYQACSHPTQFPWRSLSVRFMPLLNRPSTPSHRSIVFPRPADHLWIVTDGPITKRDLGATVCVTRDDRLRLAGF